MMIEKICKMSWLAAFGVAAFVAFGAQAQQMLPTDTEASQLEDAIAKTTGDF